MTIIKRVLWIAVSVLALQGSCAPTFHLNTDLLSQSPVRVDLHVMSKCPDAVQCEDVFFKVLSKVRVPVKFDINYIAEADASEPFKHKCKHGNPECLGNIQQLCFHHVYPDWRDWFAFNLCMNQDYGQIGLENDLAPNCARHLKLDYALVDSCVHDIGVELLKDSANVSKDRGIRTSCSILLNNELNCVHDGTWKNCAEGTTVEDFVQAIESRYV
ncbi:hypothetical protein BC940DRAFT_292579 [Gongronella butleri]|nr:hypothetical protein BC940DRAFT_292579 [Gongronella butleri]